MAIDTVNEVTQAGVRRMIRSGQWKLLFGETVQLFDLSGDPFELVDLAGRPEHAATCQKLRTELESWLASRDHRA